MVSPSSGRRRCRGRPGARVPRRGPCRPGYLPRERHPLRAWAMFALGELELSLGRAEVAVRHLEALEGAWKDMRLRDVDLWPGPELADALLRVGRAENAVAVTTPYPGAAAAKGQWWRSPTQRPQPQLRRRRHRRPVSCRSRAARRDAGPARAVPYAAGVRQPAPACPPTRGCPPAAAGGARLPRGPRGGSLGGRRRCRAASHR